MRSSERVNALKCRWVRKKYTGRFCFYHKKKALADLTSSRFWVASALPCNGVRQGDGERRRAKPIKFVGTLRYGGAR